ncbi:MAG: hypothetical protein U0269_08600 [Polyangiales bacterium]
MNRSALCMALGSLLVAGCAPLNVAGTYSGAVTNRDNGCMLSNYNVGDMTSGINMVVTQSGSDVTVDVQGLAGVALSLFTANPDPMRGTATPVGFSVSKIGRNGTTSGDCTYNTVVEANGTLNGDSLSGTVTYRYQVTNAAACGFRATCRTEQSFAFVRPPR